MPERKRYAVAVDFVVEATDEEDAVVVASSALRSLKARGTMPASAVLGDVRGGGDPDEVYEVSR